MSSYMAALKVSTGYESLKVKYMRQLARNYPNLQGEPELDKTLPGDMDRDIVECDDEVEVSMAILPINPIIEKDKQIADLEKTLLSLREKVATIPDLVKGLEEAKAENKRILNASKQVGRRLSVTRKANEQKMVSLIRTGSNWTEDSAHMACSHAATMNDDDYELDSVTDEVKPNNKRVDFMKKVEDHLDMTDKLQEERLTEMKRMIMEQMKKTKVCSPDQQIKS